MANLLLFFFSMILFLINFLFLVLCCKAIRNEIDKLEKLTKQNHYALELLERRFKYSLRLFDTLEPQIADMEKSLDELQHQTGFLAGKITMLEMCNDKPLDK